MTLTQKENLRRFYNHELPEYFPDLGKALHTHMFYGIEERPLSTDADAFGVLYAKDPILNVYNIPREPYVLADVTKWREVVKFPDVDGADWEQIAADSGITDEIRKEKLISVLLQAGIYERYHSLLGMEEAMVALLEEPQSAKELIDAIGEYKYKLIEKILKYFKPDILRQHDDYGTQNAMQMRPELWRELIKPHTKRIIELCHANGAVYEQHSCGIVEPIIPDFVEIGVDSWNGMHINNVVRLKELTGNRLNYNMSLNIPDYQVADDAGVLTEEMLRRDVYETIKACSVGGGYFCGNASVIGGGKWWGADVINDVIAQCRNELTY